MHSDAGLVDGVKAITLIRVAVGMLLDINFECERLCVHSDQATSACLCLQSH